MHPRPQAHGSIRFSSRVERETALGSVFLQCPAVRLCRLAGLPDGSHDNQRAAGDGMLLASDASTGVLEEPSFGVRGWENAVTKGGYFWKMEIRYAYLDGYLDSSPWDW